MLYGYFFVDIQDMKVFEDDVYVRAVLKNEHDNKLFKVIHLVESDFTWFEIVWDMPLKEEFSYGNGYLYAVEAFNHRLYKYKPMCRGSKRDNSERVVGIGDGVEEVTLTSNTLWVLFQNNNIMKKDTDSGSAEWELFDAIECNQNIRKAFNIQK